MSDAKKYFKTYDLPESPAPLSNPTAAEALANGSVTKAIVVDNESVQSGAFKTGVSGWSLNPDGSIEAQSAVIRGNITALSGAIGGWSIVSNTLKSGAVTLDAGNKQLLFDLATAPLTGKGIFIGLSGGVYQFRAGDPDGDYILWNGTDLSITGAFNATSGTIGGWSIDATSIKDAAGLVGLSSAVTAGDDIRFWAGHATPASAPFSVTEAGALKAQSGIIGGWAITATTLSSDGILLDAGNKVIESSNYVSGVFGAGFHIDSNLLEVGNIACRGLIRTAVFQKDVVSTVGGNLAVLDGDVLDEDMTADD